ncbi:MAG: hypothetical protein MUF34_01975 [Polyangiaceae bacterium]|jgi:hypothetical protein|nr:hypothetical protein [Polyangiaceae bacterium]
MKKAAFILLVAGASWLTGCGGSPAVPFNTMDASRVVVYRLQNYEPTPAAAGATGIPGLPGLPLPPEITSWAQQATSILPPNLLPPGIFPGTAAAPAAGEARFNNFRIIAQTDVMSTATKKELADIFGHSSNFDNTMSPCMYAEFGMRVEQSGSPADTLISLSCDHVDAVGYAWPHADRGLKPDTVKRFAKVMQGIWGG